MVLAAALLSGLLASAFVLSGTQAREAGSGEVYSVIELDFEGPHQTPADVPARDITFWGRFRHESGNPTYQVHGFWDGDGQGNASGSTFKIRFTPTEPGRWTLEEVHSNDEQLDGQQEGVHITAIPADHPGFWVVDEDSPGQRWFKRSDGSHPYIYGNTHYTFLSGYGADDQPSGNDIAEDVSGNAGYFKKLRFGLHGDYYPHPEVRPYLDDEGNPTDEGDFSHRPNPAWFHERVDLAVQTAFDHDLIADLILAGPDTEESRSTLRAHHNDGDPTPYLRYIAARYGSYPNVWITLSNEYDIRTPTYTEEEIARFGQIIQEFLPYQTPVSVHPTGHGRWDEAFDTLPDWNTHLIIQRKLRHLAPAADVIGEARSGGDDQRRRKPVINDELSYQGEGDEHDEEDTIESHLGAFLGGGYATTGEKPENKRGQYFRGKFDSAEHTAADNLGWLREQIDAEITFWKMAPDQSIFSNLDEDFRAMAWSGQEYVLGTNAVREDLVADLPEGTWTVTRYDVMAKEAEVLSTDAANRFTFDAPNSRTVLFHFQRNSSP